MSDAFWFAVGLVGNGLYIGIHRHVDYIYLNGGFQAIQPAAGVMQIQ